MNTKHTLLLTSSSALAAGVAQAAIHYSSVNVVIPLPPTPGTYGYLDPDANGVADFGFGFDGYTAANHQKPYVLGYPNYDSGSAVLARFNASDGAYGVPVATFGTKIDQDYLPPNLTTATG